ncbi:sulfotransferase family 2 domain-containing protein [Janibacter cremeus]|uniref:sulfotransferase family 2 domain-containing protein n=1 Tax=Janibacter cremeus TaxID=1285192 RepID=UPI0023F6E51C|nr:sulfotransferase family 2 domain-containing protein [Janibacter cremeus]WEV77646.1 sulfotransferase family 2 domain-containing protein [Janibacter cremeus]
MPVFRQGERKFLFIHIPKTGGSSIERAFADAGWDTLYRDGRVGRRSWNDIRRCTPQHMHREMLEALFRIERFDGVFTVVRDPMARIKSEYLWRHRTAEFSIDGRSVEKWTAGSFARYAKDPFLFDNHLRPQVDFLVDRAEVFRFEDGLDQMAAALNKKWDLGLPEQLPRVREGSSTTKYASKDVEVTPGMRDLVHDMYGEDYARFGYEG